MQLIFLIFFLVVNSLWASPDQGKNAADDFLQDPKIKTTIIPNYQSGADHIGKMKYEKEVAKHPTWQQNQSIDPSHLAEMGANQGIHERVGEQIITAEHTRPRFDEIIDLALIATAEKFSENPTKELMTDGSRERLVATNSKYSIKTCQHSRAAEEHQCIKYLQDPTVEVTPAKYSHFWCTSGAHRPDDPSCRAKKYYPQARIYQEKIVRVSAEHWVSECHVLEKRTAHNECKIIKEECLDKEPHIINGETIVKPCWKYQYTYECKYPVEVSCEPLLKQGCSPLNSKCIFRVNEQHNEQHDGKCYIWEQKYQCPLVEDNLQHITQYVRPFCLEGECFNTEYAPNDEMLSAVSQLDIFSQMQQDLRSDFNYIFKGATQACNRLCLGIKNCCKLSGWGKDLGLVGCNENEKQLADNRTKGLCVEVGTFCAERVPVTGICLRKKTNFCCFHSKLTKAIQEQGRVQLGMNFGAPKEPDCRGLTVDELSKIDFSKLNLVEAFSDLKPQLQDPTILNQKLQQKLKNLQIDVKSQMQGEK